MNFSKRFRPHRIWMGIAFMVFGGTNAVQAQCQGINLFETLKTRNPVIYEKVQKEASNMPFHEGKFFSVTKEGTAPSYIFGTMHSGDPRITQFSPKVISALAQANTVAFELKEAGGLNDPKTVEQMGATIIPYIMATANERVSTLFSPEEKEKIAQIIEKYGMPSATVDLFKPGFLGAVLSVPPCDAKNQEKQPPVDTLLAQKATKEGKSFVGLETLEEQLQIIASQPPEIQKAVLSSALNQQEKGEDIFVTMIELYQKGQIGILIAWSQSEDIVSSEEDAKHMEKAMTSLIDDRNTRMFERSLPLVENGGAFIAVGAAHLPGETGILKLYEKAGYIIEKIE